MREIVLQSPMDSSEGSIVSFGPEDLHLLIACWTPAVRFFGKLLRTGLAMVANARFWSFFPSSRSLIEFVANAASSCTLKLTRSRKTQINACCRCWGAWTLITFPLDIPQSPGVVRSCHSVETTRSRETGVESYVVMAMVFSLEILYFLQHQIHFASDPKIRNVFRQGIGVLPWPRKLCCVE